MPKLPNNPLIVIVGQTASGKSTLAIELALKFDGEIICADARTVYKGMDIGTSKTSKEDQALVPHHLLDVVNPDEPFTAADFKRLAVLAIEDISARGKLPIMVGGTGLYVDAVLFDYEFRKVDPELRAELETLSVAELQTRITEQGLTLPNNPGNPRHLLRVLESKGQPHTQKPLRPNTEIYGLEVDKTALQARINKRTRQMIEQGLIEEAESLVSRYSWDAPGLNAIGYRELRPFFDGLQSQEATVVSINHDTYLYAKRQKTWFKRNKSIRWVREQSDAVDIATTFLNKTKP